MSIRRIEIAEDGVLEDKDSKRSIICPIMSRNIRTNNTSFCNINCAFYHETAKTLELGKDQYEEGHIINCALVGDMIGVLLS